MVHSTHIEDDSFSYANENNIFILDKNIKADNSDFYGLGYTRISSWSIKSSNKAPIYAKWIPAS